MWFILFIKLFSFSKIRKKPTYSIQIFINLRNLINFLFNTSINELNRFLLLLIKHNLSEKLINEIIEVPLIIKMKVVNGSCKRRGQCDLQQNTQGSCVL